MFDGNDEPPLINVTPNVQTEPTNVLVFIEYDQLSSIDDIVIVEPVTILLIIDETLVFG